MANNNEQTLAFNLFYLNFDNLKSNLERILWSLKNTKDVLDSNEDLVTEFDEIFDFDYDDIDDKIEETKKIIYKQFYVLLISYFDDYLNLLLALLENGNNKKMSLSDLEKIIIDYKRKKRSNKIFNYVELDNKKRKIINDDMLKYFEIRDAIIHRKSKIKKEFISILKKYITKNKSIVLTDIIFNELSSSVYKLCEMIDDIAKSKISSNYMV